MASDQVLKLTARDERRGSLTKNLRRYYWFYLFLIIPLAFYIIFCYGPMYGAIIAFKNYRIADGIWGSKWVGFAHFLRFFRSPEFINVLRNTLLLNIYGLIFGFPAPIILAVLLSEVRSVPFKRIAQSILYIPHFLSWVVVVGILLQMLSPSTGVVNLVLKAMGMQPIYFMADKFWWVFMYVLSGIWANMGWDSIIYLAAITAIDPQLYEAARIDGAGKFGQMWHITLPGIRPTIAIILILSMGRLLNLSFEHIYNMQNPVVYSVSDVIVTYVYRTGIQGAQFSYTTAIGLFQSVVSTILVVAANKITKILGETSLW
jgi:putative aldouronate transport system permease protein